MPKEPLSYTQRYQILAGITAFTDYTARQNAINEGTVINLDAFKPNGDASIMTTIRGGAFAIASAAAEAQALAPPVALTPPEPEEPPTVPDAPLSLCVIPSDSALNIYFFQPSDGGSQITNYSYSTDGTTFTPLSPAQTTTPLTISGLTNGTVYTVYLKAINAVGASLPSAAITAAPIPSSFSPVSITGLNLWLDAHNTSNVILSGSNVSAWNDSSYETHNFTAGPSGIITYDKPSSINDRPALTFATANPTATYLSNTFNISPGSNQLSVFMIVNQTGTTTGNSELFFTQNNFRHFDIFNNSNNGLLSLNVGDSIQVSSTIDIITSPPIVVIISVLVSTTASMYVNGTLTGVNGAARGVLSLDEDLTWAISGRAFLGSIGEVIAYPTAVTDTERQKVEAYLAWKWGLQSNLPATNPWQLTPPSGDSPPGAPTLDVILSGNTVVYIYYTAGTGTSVNYQYTTDAGSSYTSFSPPDIVSPNVITDVANGSPITVQFRSYNGGGSSSISNSLTATPSQPAVPAAWLVFDPNNATSYSGSGTLNNIGTFGPLSGTVTGAVTYVTGTGITGKVLNFNGGYVAFPTFNFGSAFTISAWVNPSAKFSINGLLTNGFPNANTAGFKFGWNGWQTTNYSMLFENGDGTAGNWYVPSSLINTVTPGVWQMLTVIFDRVGRTSLFLRNGVPVGVYGITTASNMTVTGAFNIGAYMGGSYTMKAQLGLLKVYNSALTASQVYDDFLADTTSFGLPGPPTAPTLSATPDNLSVSIAFTQGSNGGSAITNYSYSIDGTTFTPFSPAKTTSPLTVTGLTNGTPYTIYVKAINALGSSAASAPVTVTPVALTDRIISTLTTSLSAYNAANTDDWVAITVTEYNNLNTNVTSTTKVGIDDSYLSTATGSGLTNTNTALVANSATAKSLAIPANNYLYAFAVKLTSSQAGIDMSVFTNTNSAAVDGFNRVGSLLPTISSPGISYFVRKSPSATNGPSGLLGFFSGTKMDYPNPSFTGSGGYISFKTLQGTGLTPIPAMRYLLGTGTPPPANSTLAGNLGGYGAFCIQGLATGTLQWN
jgi:titin